jgi:hypothetical protein
VTSFMIIIQMWKGVTVSYGNRTQICDDEARGQTTTKYV